MEFCRISLTENVLSLLERYLGLQFAPPFLLVDTVKIFRRYINLKML